MKSIEIVPGVDWVGALDPQLRVFDVIMQAEHGTTYNSYLVQGEEKIALIDANKEVFSGVFIERLKSVVDLAKIDYIVLNHMEPDHSGAISKLLDVAPNATVVLTRPGLAFANAIANRDFASQVVKDGDELDLGGRTLKFILAPYLHWPDTMFTYLVEDGILFPCDFLGAHYCDDRMFNDLVDNYEYAFHYYFMAIMRPFKPYVRAGLEKIKDLKLNVVCPSHGPILREGLDSYLERYAKWSAQYPARDKKRLLVFYVSAYGNTEKLAGAICDGAAGAGADTSIFDLTAVDMGMVLEEMEQADGIAVGTCTINGDALEHAWELLSSLATIDVKKKLGASFGSYGWSGEGPKMLAERMRGLKFRVPEDPLRVQLVPTDEDLEQSRAYGAKLAGQL